MEFESFPKLYRLNGPVIVTEKIDGTNAQIYIGEDGTFLVGSRTKWITPDKDNHGFAKWAYDNKPALITLLGIGKHYGEWWGKGIQRGYALQTKRFSLFNTSRWVTEDNTYALDAKLGVYVVPVLYSGQFDTFQFAQILNRLKEHGSYASPGFMTPEGIVIYDTRSGTGFKKTYDYDDSGKGATRDEHGNVLV